MSSQRNYLSNLLFKIIILAILIISGNTVFSQHRQEIHSKHFLFGYPYGTPETNDLIIRDIYALSSNDSTKFADWVAYLLTKNTISGKNKKRKWAADPWLEDDETLEPNDYKGANKALKVDRGHQAPLADFSNTSDYYQTNYLSNITPQKSELNQGPWKKLEDFERELLKLYDTIYVMTGPIYEKYFGTLPNADEPHKIPSGYWKIITFNSGDTLTALAFIMEQETPRKFDFTKSITTVDEIEKLTGLDFFWELDDNTENKLEATNNKKVLNNLKNRLNNIKN